KSNASNTAVPAATPKSRLLAPNHRTIFVGPLVLPHPILWPNIIAVAAREGWRGGAPVDGRAPLRGSKSRTGVEWKDVAATTASSPTGCWPLTAAYLVRTRR